MLFHTLRCRVFGGKSGETPDKDVACESEPTPAHSRKKPTCKIFEHAHKCKHTEMFALCLRYHLCVCVYDVNREQRPECQAGLH